MTRAAISSKAVQSAPATRPATTNRAADSSDLVEIARETRLSAQRFAQIVSRFGTEMPDHLDRFHETMIAFRSTVLALRS